MARGIGRPASSVCSWPRPVGPGSAHRTSALCPRRCSGASARSQGPHWPAGTQHRVGELEQRVDGGARRPAGGWGGPRSWWTGGGQSALWRSRRRSTRFDRRPPRPPDTSPRRSAGPGCGSARPRSSKFCAPGAAGQLGHLLVWLGALADSLDKDPGTAGTAYQRASDQAWEQGDALVDWYAACARCEVGDRDGGSVSRQAGEPGADARRVRSCTAMASATSWMARRTRSPYGSRGRRSVCASAASMCSVAAPNEPRRR